MNYNPNIFGAGHQNSLCLPFVTNCVKTFRNFSASMVLNFHSFLGKLGNLDLLVLTFLCSFGLMYFTRGYMSLLGGVFHLTVKIMRFDNESWNVLTLVQPTFISSIWWHFCQGLALSNKYINAIRNSMYIWWSGHKEIMKVSDNPRFALSGVSLNPCFFTQLEGWTKSIYYWMRYVMHVNCIR